MTARQRRGVAQLTAGVALMLLAIEAPQPLGLALVAVGLVLLVTA